MKIIMSKNHDEIYNFEKITNIYIGSYANADGYIVKAAAGSQTRGGVLGKYNTYDEARTALGMLFKQLDCTDIVTMPSDEAVKTYITKEHHHHIAGKKTKSYGKS